MENEALEILKALKHSMEIITAKVTSMEERLDRMEGQGTALEERLDRMEGKLTAMDQRLERIEDGQKRHEAILGELSVAYLENRAEIRELKRVK